MSDESLRAEGGLTSEMSRTRMTADFSILEGNFESSWRILKLD